MFVEPLEDFTRVGKLSSGMLRNMQAVQKNGVDGTSRIKVFECQKRNIGRWETVQLKSDQQDPSRLLVSRGTLCKHL